MKRLHFFAFAVIAATAVFLPHSILASDQDADTLRWNNRKYVLEVAWDCPSVVQIFFNRSASEGPFQSWSTSNNRGHIAHFEILDNKLYLSHIDAKRYRTRSGNLWTEGGIDTTAEPAYFGIYSLAHSGNEFGGAVVADWFSGVLRLRMHSAKRNERSDAESSGTRYLYVVNGTVVDNLLVSDKELRIFTYGEKTKKENSETKRKRDIVNMHQRYATFYIRGGRDRETVVFNGHSGLVEQKNSGMPLFMELYGNDPYSWYTTTAGQATTGAPFGTWVIDGDSLYLASVAVHSGAEPYSYDSIPVSFADALPDSVLASSTTGSKILAQWISGSYTVQYGKWEVTSFGVKEYTVYKTQRLRIKEGRILSSQFSPRGFDDEPADESSLGPCNPDNIYATGDTQLEEAVGKYRQPKSTPSYKDGKSALRNFCLNIAINDDRIKDRLFRVRVAFLVTCEGHAGNWQLINKSRGELFEMSSLILEKIKQIPDKWIPAVDKKGNNVDCWQVLELTVSNGAMTNANYK